jgi:uncharacterized GH25 family protein
MKVNFFMHNVITKQVLLAASVAVISVAAGAHETWLWSIQRTVTAGATLNIEMTSGDIFPLIDSGVRPERVAKAACIQGSEKFTLTPVVSATVQTPDNKVLAFIAKPPAAGGVTCYTQLYPKILDLALNKVEIYLNDIDASAETRAASAASPKPKRWIESYTKNSKVIVPAQVSPQTRTIYQPTPVGLGLEFVPEIDLTTGEVLDNLPILVLRDGKPLTGLSIELISERGIKPVRIRSDKDGRVVFAAPAAGRWMLSATDLNLVNAKKSIWESQFSTLVFEVLPK